MNRQDIGQAIKIANPKTIEFQVVRTSLIPGLLKTIRENRSHALPLKIFEVSDVAVKDVALERQARNVRNAAALWCNKNAGFEVVHGLLDRVMQILDVPYIVHAKSSTPTGYYIEESNGTQQLFLLMLFSNVCMTQILAIFLVERLRFSTGHQVLTRTCR